MDNNIPKSIPSPRFRWVWRVCWVVLFLCLVGALYRVMTMEPVLYSPAEVVRSYGDYKEKMNPPRHSEIGRKVPEAVMPQMKVTTNQQGRVRIEYPAPGDKREDVVGFTLHRVEPGETVQAGELSIQLKRIGHLWVPPGTNWQQGTSANIPAQFYGTDMRPLSDAEVKQDLTNQWDRTMNCRAALPAYRFDLEIRGGKWKFLGAQLYDTRTHTELTTGTSSQHSGDFLYKIRLDPFLWHATPVELVVDLVLGPEEVEELRPQVGESFSVGGSRYQLILAADKLSAENYSQGSDGKTSYLELGLPFANKGQKKSLLLFNITPVARQNVFEMDYLDAGGKVTTTAGGNWSGAEIIQNLRCELADVKTIRVRKFSAGHRFVFRLPRLPGLPPENQQVDNLFAVRVPLLRFDREWEQEEYIRGISQLGMPYISRPSLPPGTYPRWLTNATVAEVLEDYRQAMGVTNYFYVDREKLTIEKGDRDWLQQVQEKVMKTWKRLMGP